MGERQIYLCDIDGTIADLTHRLHFIQQPPPDWDRFFDACSEDTPIYSVIDIIKALWKVGFDIVMVSGRSERVREKTEKWLANHNIQHSGLYMRREGDHRPDNIVKSELLDRIRQDFDGLEIRGVFDDRKQVVDMFRARGLRVFQVAEGNF